MSKNPWFSYDPEDGVEFHADEAAARLRAEQTLEAERDIAADGWREEVEAICYGRVYGETRQISAKPAPEGSEFNEIVDYAIIDVAPPDAAAKVAALESEVARLRALSAARFTRGAGPVPASLRDILGDVQVTPEGVLLTGDAWPRLKAAWERLEYQSGRESGATGGGDA